MKYVGQRDRNEPGPRDLDLERATRAVGESQSSKERG